VQQEVIKNKDFKEPIFYEQSLPTKAAGISLNEMPVYGFYQPI
jgi:hypothetical protein